MRKLFLLLLIITFSTAIFAQINRDSLNTYTPEPISAPEPITTYEYFFDTDPGYGNGSIVTITSTDSLYQNLAIDVTLLSHDFHTLGLRTKNDTGAWSETAFTTFYIDDINDSLNVFNPQSLVNPEPIIEYEYFFDNDPGYGNGLHVTVASTDSLYQDIIAAIDTLTYDFHTLGIRVKNEVNAWSETAYSTFYNTYISDSLNTYEPEPILDPEPIVAYEYFFDTDPGYANAILVNATSTDSLNIDFIEDVTALSHDFHTLGIRTQNNVGTWSETAYTTFYIDDINDSLNVFIPDPLTTPQPIAAYEYFFDLDPGYGNATFANTASTDSLYTDFVEDVTALPHDFHTLGVRSINENNAWSETAYITFYVDDINDSLNTYEPEPIPTPAQITRAEYFWSDRTGSTFGPYTINDFASTDSLWYPFTFDSAGMGLVDPVLLHLTVYNQDNAFACYAMQLVGISGAVSGVWSTSTWISGDIYLPDENSLLIEEGVPVYFWQDVDFSVYGTLNIAGTPANPVVINNVYAGDNWDGIVIESETDSVLIDNVEFNGTSNGIVINENTFRDIPSDFSPKIAIRNILLNGLEEEGSTGITIDKRSCLIENNDIFGFTMGISILDSGDEVIVVRNNRVRPNQSRKNSGSRDNTIGIHAANFDTLVVMENDIAGFNDLVKFENGTNFNFSDNLLGTFNGTELVGLDVINSYGKIRNNTFTGLPLSMRITDSNGLSIKNNAFYSTGSLPDDRILEFYNSTALLEQQTYPDFHTALYADTGSILDIRNSIFIGNTINLDGLGNYQVSYSNAPILLPGDNNTTGDPEFVDYLGGDYHLLSTSPCIDSGDQQSVPDPDFSRADLGSFPFEHPVILSKGSMSFTFNSEINEVYIINSSTQSISDFSFEHSYPDYSDVFIVEMPTGAISPEDSAAVQITFSPTVSSTYLEDILLHYIANKYLILHVSGSETGINLIAPQNVMLVLVTNSALLSWDVVEGANYYKVFHSLNSTNSNVGIWELISETPYTQLSVIPQNERSFYYVIAVYDPQRLIELLKETKISKIRHRIIK